MYATLAVRRSMDPVALKNQLDRSAKLFEGWRTVNGKTFAQLEFMLRSLVGEDGVAPRRDWFQRARLWRLVLLQHREGFWDCWDGLALPLLADEMAPGELEVAIQYQEQKANSCFSKQWKDRGRMANLLGAVTGDIAVRCAASDFGRTRDSASGAARVERDYAAGGLETRLSQV